MWHYEFLILCLVCFSLDTSSKSAVRLSICSSKVTSGFFSNFLWFSSALLTLLIWLLILFWGWLYCLTGRSWRPLGRHWRSGQFWTQAPHSHWKLYLARYFCLSSREPTENGLQYKSQISFPLPRK